MFEKLMNGNDSFPGTGPFVAIFGQSNEGDVSPNTRGATCPDGITPCTEHSECEGMLRVHYNNIIQLSRNYQKVYW